MAGITGAWYKAEYTPQDTTGQVGGSIDLGSPLAGSLNEIFEPGQSKFLGRGDYERFRKVFFQNDGNDITEAVLFWSDIEHIDQLYFAVEKTPGDTTTDSLTMPAGYAEGDFWNPVGLIDASGIDDITGSGVLGVWLWQKIPPGLSPDTGAIATLTIAGNVL